MPDEQPTPPLTVKAVLDCARSGWSLKDTAEEFCLTYSQIYRFVNIHNISKAFRHGNKKVKNSY